MPRRDFDFAVVLQYLPDLLVGVLNTLELTALSLLLGGVLGLGLALARISGRRIIAWPAYAYIELFRTTPPLIQIVWIYFVLPVLIHHEIDSFEAAALALGLNCAAFFAEIFRAGIQGIAASQREAAQVLGLNRLDAMRFVILPQAMRLVLAPTGAMIILVLKGTSLASWIGMLELTRIGQLVTNATFRPLESLTVVAVLYFAMGYPIALLARGFERRLQARR
jgi:polar amino acid transport system permease protein